jgi:cobalt/nickel transport system permease protein
VVLQTLLSGKSELPFGAFALMMQPIHLAIGLVEGVITAAVIGFVRQARPELLEGARPRAEGPSIRTVAVLFLAAAAITGGLLSWFSSTRPDGLEWAVERVFGRPGLPETEQGAAAVARGLQEKTAVLPDYGFTPSQETTGAEGASSWPKADPGTSLSGLIGAAAALALSAVLAAGVRAFKRRSA